MPIDNIWLSFIFYSFIGWLYESVICSMITEHHFINRGFLLGPYCPVYGVGAVICYLCLGRIENPLILFFDAMFLCSLIEYVTGYGMEKLFHARWWDYSKFPFQLHGRICLYGALIFGLSNVLICFIVQPEYLEFLKILPPVCSDVLVVISAFLFITDTVTTLIAWTNLNRSLDALHKWLSEKSNNSMEGLSDYFFQKIPYHILHEKSGIQICMNNWNMKLKKRELRFLHAFPHIKLLRHEGMIQRLRIKEHIKNVFDKI